MVVADLVAVHQLECAAQLAPWGVDHFTAELNNPCAHIALGFLQGQLAGYICWWLIAGEVQIQNVATLPLFRRRGVAACLLSHVFDQCRANGFDSAWLEVRVSNASAIALYERYGFTTVGSRPRYYADGEDALVMCLENR
jgi:[ribosomal protein S18]-alanine N-acetyltransferase